MKFSAAVLRAYESRFAIEDVLLNAGPAEGEILVRIAGCGMCRTDIAVRRSAGRSPLPAVLGHEGAGTVVETGGRNTGLNNGDHVVLSFDSCGHCRNCMDAAPSYCDSFASLRLINDALHALRPTGHLGLVARLHTTLPLEPGALDRGRRISHICEGDAVPGLLIPRLTGLWQAGRFPFDELIQTYPLTDINEAERDCEAGRVVKPVVIPEGRSL